MKNKIITLVQAENWLGIYVDGKLLDQDHTVDTSDVLKLLGFEVEEVFIDDSFFDDDGYLPETWATK